MPYNYQAARQAGLTDQQIEQYLNSKGRSLQTEMGGQQAQPKQNQWADWLPLAGAVGGSFIPGAGTILGGAAGAGLATLLKGELQGGINPGEVATETALGGAGGVLGKGIGAVAGKIAGRGAGKAAAGAAGQVAKTGAQKTAQGLAAKTLASNFRVPPKIAGEYRVEEALNQFIDDGIKIPNSLGGYKQIADKVTGANGAITKAQQIAASKLKTKINYEQPLTTAHDNVAMQGAIKDDATVLRKIRNYFKATDVKTPGHIDPIEALDIANKLERQGYQLKNSSTELSPNLAAEQEGAVFVGVADDLRNQIYRAVDTEGLFPQIQQQVLKEISPLGYGLSQRVAQTQNMTQLRSVASPYVRISKAYESTIRRNQTPFNAGGLQLGTRGAGALAGGSIAGLPGAAAGAMFAPAAQGIAEAAQPALTGMGAKAILGAGKLASGAGKLPLPQGATGQLISQGIGQGAVRAGMPQPQGQESIEGGEGTDQINASRQAAVQGLIDQGIDNPEQMLDYLNFDEQGNQVGDFTLQEVQTYAGGTTPKTSQTGLPDDQTLRLAFAQAILQNPKQASAIKAAYDLIGGRERGEKEPVTLVQRKTLAKSGNKNLDIVEKELKKDPTVLTKQLIPGTWLSRRFDSAMFRTVEALLRARTGAAAPEQEVRRYMNQFGPRFGDDEETALEKLDLLRQEFQTILQERGQSTIPTPQNYSGLLGAE